MRTNKSHTVELSDRELQLIESLKENPEMLDQFTSITQKFNAEIENGMDAHEAECHVIKSIKEVGRSMISKWAEKAQLEAVAQACSSEETIKNGKKNSTGIAPSAKSSSKPK